MNEIFFGWDVGGWNCDTNPKSRDAICALELQGNEPRLIKARRTNVREALISGRGPAVVDALLDPLGVSSKERRVTIAIDAPLAWPSRMIRLVTADEIVDVPREADDNPYLFRKQELQMFRRERQEGVRPVRPLSPVRDMIGSQSTKAIHFLRAAQLQPAGTGVWERGSTTAIETYPSASRDEDLKKRSDQLLQQAQQQNPGERGEAWKKDIADAVTCALIAWLYRCDSERLESPGDASDPVEGWIWLPRTVAAASA